MEKSIYRPLQEKLQKMLRELRLDAKLQQVELASLIKKPQSFVSKYENGERILDFIELREICIILGYTIIEFAKRYEDEINES